MAPVDPLLFLYPALLSGDPRAPERFLQAAAPRLRAILRRRHAALPSELVLDAATDALLFCIQRPERYRRASGSLLNFLVHIADNRVRDALRRIQRRKEILAADLPGVEFLAISTNEEYMPADAFPIGDPEALPPELEALLCGILPDPADRQLWELVCRERRASAADYIALLNLAHLPPDQQKLEVKRRRDKVVARVRRHRKEFQELL